MCNRTCHAKLRVRRKSLNLRKHGAGARTRQMQRVFAFGISLFANEHSRKPLYLLAISLLTFCRRRRLMLVVE